jgi:Arc/MetJ-type ribon-helix-helix transcriptional regulator
MVQVRFPRKIAEFIDELVRQGFYKSRSEFIVDASRRLLGRKIQKSRITKFVEEYLKGKVYRSEHGYEKVREICEKIRESEEWKKKFEGKTMEEVMAEVRGRSSDIH